MKKLYEKDAIDSINEGVNKVVNIVKKTLGGRGKNVIIKDSAGGIHIINDGVTIANQIELDNQAQDIGASLTKKVAQKTNEQAGDGTTTSILLFQKYVNLMNSITDRSRQAREAMEQEVESICKELNKVKKEISESEIEPVARISCLNDKMAKVISDVIKEIGKDGAIIVEDAQKPTISYNIEKGIKIDDGYSTPYLITESGGQKAILTDVPVLLSRKKLDDMTALMPMLEDLAKVNSRRIAIFAKEISDDVLTFFVVNKVQGKMNPIIVTTSDLNEIETVTGAKIITEENGLEFELDNLGRAGKIVVSRDSSTVIDGKAEPSRVKGKIDHLKKLLEEADETADKYELQERIAKLSGGVAVIKIAGNNDQETQEQKLKMEDAINAVRSAMDEGVVEGGGMALWRIAKRKYSKPDNELQEIMSEILRAPLIQLLENAEVESTVIKELDKVENLGYNVVTGQYENFFDKGILDPIKVTKSALRNAVTMGNMLLTSEAAIVDITTKTKK